MRKFYDTNADFKRYVDAYCVTRKCSVDEALEHALVKEVADSYGKSGKGVNAGNSTYMDIGECK